MIIIAKRCVPDTDIQHRPEYRKSLIIMECSLCNTNHNYENMVFGPMGLALCHQCIESLSDFDGINIDGACSWCGGSIGESSGIFGENIRLAVGINNKESNIILCNECGSQCNQYIRYADTA